MNPIPRHAHGRVRRPAREAGAALVAVLLVLMVLGGGFLIEALTSSSRARVASTLRHADVLAKAKAALIARAVADANRPGSLPCPDIDYDGVYNPTIDAAGPNCRTGIGWLPYRTLDLPELRDASGARLWYGLSANYRAPGPDVLNSETAGSLTVDGANDVVAVIIAPGEALQGQVRPDSATARDATDAGQRDDFLEGANPVDDDAFVTAGAGVFNDRLNVVTRGELMRAVEKRVAGDVAASLRQYAASWGPVPPPAVLPWLKPFEDPRGPPLDLHGVPGQSSGLLPMHPPDGSNESVDATFTVTWSGLTQPLDELLGTTVAESDVRNGPGVTQSVTIAAAGDDCDYTAGQPGRVRCGGAFVAPFPNPTYLGDPVVPALSSRTFTFDDLELVTADPSVATAIAAPTTTSPRTRTVAVTPGVGNFVDGDLTVEDRVVVSTATGNEDKGVVGRGVISFDASSTGNVTISGVPYYLVPGVELPAYVTAHNWHHLVYVESSPAYMPGGTGDCVASGNCVTLTASGGTVFTGTSDVPPAFAGVAVLVAGPELTSVAGTGPGGAGQDRSPPGVLEDYFEQENADDPITFPRTAATRELDIGAGGTPFNDLARVLLTDEL